MVTTISGADAYPANAAKTQYAITVAILAQVIDQDVPIAEGPGYAARDQQQGTRARRPGRSRRAAAREAAAAGDGRTRSPRTSGSSSTSCSPTEPPQADVDAILAAVPQGDATEDAAPDDSDAGETWELDGFDCFDPEELA